MLLWICHFEHGQNSWTINQLLMKIINIVLYLFISYQQVWTKYQIQLSVCVAGGWFVVFLFTACVYMFCSGLLNIHKVEADFVLGA